MRSYKQMKLFVENKKMIIIVVFVLICGVVLQISRSQFILETAKNTNNSIQLSESISESVVVQSETLLNAPYCIVYNDETLRIKNNVEKTLQYMKKSYRTYNTALAGINLSNCETVLHTTAFLDHLGSIEDIEYYVQNGGKLILLQTLEPTSHFRVLHPHLGILHHNFFTETRGIQMTSNLLIGAKGKKFLYESLTDISLDIVLKNDLEVYIRNDQNLPIAWKAPFKQGHFVIFNANMLSEKMARGIIAGLLSISEETYIYPIFNSKTFYIDDFPAPLPEGTIDVIYGEFERDLPDFFKSIWWPNMIKAANKYDLTYTGAMIQTYNDVVAPPFETSDTEALNTLIRFGRELIQSGGELGYHGYNHQSLTTDFAISDSFGYNTWQDKEHMIDALTTLNEYVQKAFPSYVITSYVPPSNVLSEVGRSALKKAVPTLVTINSLYGEDGSERSYIQEFDVGEDQIINMPRITSGYFRTDTNEWGIANAINLHGVFSHFIHPDDVISTDRSQGGWSDMYEEFEKFMGDIQARYPWLRPLTATSAAHMLANSLAMQVTFEQTDKQLIGQMEHYKEPQHFILRLPKKVKSTKGCTIEKIDDNPYLVIAHEGKFSIHY